MWKGSPGRASRVLLWCEIWLTSKEPTLTNRGWGTREPSTLNEKPTTSNGRAEAPPLQLRHRTLPHFS